MQGQGAGAQGVQQQQGRAVDMFGLDFGADYDAGGGYDHDEMAEDDY
jgi:hypothetical protein